MLLHLFFRCGFGWTKWLSAFSKLLLSFVAVTSFRFWFLNFPVAVGLDNDFKPLLFSPASARIFFVSSFNFIPQSKAVLFSRVAYRLPVDSLLFSIATFKIIPRFAVLTFFVAALV